MTQDRTVHATTADGREVVSYSRSPDKWWWETVHHRKHIDLEDAVRLATLPGSKVKLGRPGGRRFDALYRESTAKTAGSRV